MRFGIEHETRHAGRYLEHLISIVGWPVFEKRIKTLKEERIRAPVLSDFYRERHTVELELGRLVSHKRKTGRWPRKIQSKETYDTLSFAATFANVHQRLNAEGQNKLRNQVRGYLKGNATLISIRHEMAAAAHLMGQGWNVTFADLEGSDRFDFLVNRDGFEVEIDCKTISADLGRKIHRRDFRRLAGYLREPFHEHAKLSNQGRLLVTLEIEDRLPSNETKLKAFADGVIEATHLPGGRFETNNFKVITRKMRPAEIDLRKPDSIISFIVSEFGYQPNAFWVVSGTSIVIFIAISQRADEVLKAFYIQLKKAQGQFSGTRPAVLWAQIEGIDRDEWPALKSKSGLRAMSHRFLGRPSIPHICMLAYSSVGAILDRGTEIRESGVLLHFDHTESP